MAEFADEVAHPESQDAWRAIELGVLLFISFIRLPAGARSISCFEVETLL
jgi:hypothetical protein